MDFLLYALSAAVLVALFFSLMFWTNSFKNRKNKAVKDEYLRKAGIAFFAYLVLNIVRLWVEGKLI